MLNSILKKKVKILWVKESSRLGQNLILNHGKDLTLLFFDKLIEYGEIHIRRGCLGNWVVNVL